MKSWATVGLLSILCFSAHGDTYNFIFSKPKKEKKTVESTPAPTPPVVVPPKIEGTITRPYFRFGLGGFGVLGRPLDSRAFSKASTATGGPLLSFSFAPSTKFGLTLWFGAEFGNATPVLFGNSAGTLLGGEIELNFFATDATIYAPWEFNVLAGINLGTHLQIASNEAFLHLGGRLTHNVNQLFGITSALRFSTGGQMLELGIVARL